jgi:hypothetical protein
MARLFEGLRSRHDSSSLDQDRYVEWRYMKYIFSKTLEALARHVERFCASLHSCLEKTMNNSRHGVDWLTHVRKSLLAEFQSWGLICAPSKWSGGQTPLPAPRQNSDADCIPVRPALITTLQARRVSRTRGLCRLSANCHLPCDCAKTVKPFPLRESPHPSNTHPINQRQLDRTHKAT